MANICLEVCILYMFEECNYSKTKTTFLLWKKERLFETSKESIMKSFQKIVQVGFSKIKVFAQ